LLVVRRQHDSTGVWSSCGREVRSLDFLFASFMRTLRYKGKTATMAALAGRALRCLASNCCITPHYTNLAVDVFHNRDFHNRSSGQNQQRGILTEFNFKYQTLLQHDLRQRVQILTRQWNPAMATCRRQNADSAAVETPCSGKCPARHSLLTPFPSTPPPLTSPRHAPFFCYCKVTDH